ncbi:MAG: GNAT family N-acetyltransferase [Cellulomonadaceae bacterium]
MLELRVPDRADFPTRQAWLPPDRHGYYFVENGNGEALGRVHHAVDGPTAEIGFTVVPRHRGHGLGHRFLAMLVETVRRNTSVAELLNEFEDARTTAVRTHRRAGFVADARTTTHSGRAVRVWRLELDRARS